MTVSTEASGSVCVVCGISLEGRSPQARHCSPACRVEGHRFKAILNGDSCSPYKSIKERIEAAQRGVQNALSGNEGDSPASDAAARPHTALGSVISDLVSRS